MYCRRGVELKQAKYQNTVTGARLNNFKAKAPSYFTQPQKSQTYNSPLMITL